MPECDGVLLSTGEQIGGQDLGDCVAAAMFAAGTGVHRVESSDGLSSTVQFRWDPDYAMSADGDQQVVILGETGWVRTPGSGWVQADASSEDPLVVMATSIVELVRVFSDPRVLAAGLATSPTWTVAGEEAVPADDAVSDVGWRIEPDTAMTIGDVALNDVALWLRSDYLAAYFVGTGTYAGTTVTSSNTFLDWGGDVEIPDPQAP